MKKTMYRAATAALFAAFVWALPLAAETGRKPSLAARVTVVPGENWTTRMWIAFVPVSKGPQLACWIETADGRYVATLTATARSADDDWRGAPEEGRPESLPVWNAARAAGSAVDAASSATPKEGFEASRSGLGLVAGETYVIRCEVNHSFDYNDAWPKKAKRGEAAYSGVNGQPSVVYEARFVAESGTRVDLVPVGTGSVDGSSGVTKAGLDGVTSALSIIESIYAIFEEE